jgi:hypothetical protein
MWNEAIPVVEDCIEYFLYCLDGPSTDELTKVCSSCNAFSSSLVKDNIWQVAE